MTHYQTYQLSNTLAAVPIKKRRTLKCYLLYSDNVFSLRRYFSHNLEGFKLKLIKRRRKDKHRLKRHLIDVVLPISPGFEKNKETVQKNIPEETQNGRRGVTKHEKKSSQFLPRELGLVLRHLRLNVMTES
uniref:Uncharacterized protein n=1 Tax=Cacopsylla melanoneura TaxID=428564 RepID=A0A8D9BG90_9HEMI